MSVASEAEQWAKQLYARALSQWTLDQLHARRHGLDVPSPRRGEGVLGLAFAGESGGAGVFAFDLAAMLRWDGEGQRSKQAA